MNNKILLLFLTLLTVRTANAQNSIFKPAYLKYEIDSLTKTKILTSLDTLFAQIKYNRLDTSLIGKGNTEFTLLKSFSSIEDDTKNNILNFYKKQLINFYPIAKNEYWISVAFIGQRNNEMPIIRAIINLIATNTDNKVAFSVPIKYLTRTWKLQVVGNISYHFRDKIDIERAKKFDKKNTLIANKLGVKSEKLHFYMCDNYQEILQLLGFEYDIESNGKTRDGYGVDANTIFSVMNNEDFSHDVFHYYSDKMRGDIKRNRTVEEGIAYSWANAYYTKANVEMIEQKELVQNLQSYLKANSKISLLELFTKNTKIFTNLPTEISVKSTISSLLCDEVERKKGQPKPCKLVFWHNHRQGKIAK